MPSVCAWRELSHQKRVKLSTESCLLLWGHLNERHPQPPSENALATYDSETGVALEGGDGASLTGRAAGPPGADWQKWIILIRDIKRKPTEQLYRMSLLGCGSVSPSCGFLTSFPPSVAW